MGKEVFGNFSKARYWYHFFNIVFKVPSIIQTLTYGGTLFSPFLSIMQYKAISNAVNCFRSRIKHFLMV